MPVPLGLRTLVEHEARVGLGYEEICMRLKVPRKLRAEVRRIVLEMSREHQRESESEDKAVRPLPREGSA